MIKTTLEKDILKEQYKRLKKYKGYYLNSTQQNELFLIYAVARAKYTGFITYGGPDVNLMTY